MSRPKPEPIPVSIVCTICGLDWDRHSDDPTVMECVELLKADLAARSLWDWNVTTIPYPTVSNT